MDRRPFFILLLCLIYKTQSSICLIYKNYLLTNVKPCLMKKTYHFICLINKTMKKSSAHVYSRYAKEAISLLGKSIREGRISRKITTADLASRAGISRDLLYRIERGDPACGIGAVFEVAAITGVPLFEEDRGNLTGRLARSEEKLALMPKAVRASRKAVKDAF